jgi:RimJ/RimL family protein N-acetyltransferase
VAPAPCTDNAETSGWRLLGTSGGSCPWGGDDCRRLVVRHAFKPIEYGGLGRHRLELAAAQGNTASQHVALANGFTQSGIRRRASLRRDWTREDLLVFDLLVSDDERRLPFASP